MPAGEIIKNRKKEPERIRPELKLPVGFGGLAPFVEFLMDVAADTKTISAEYRDNSALVLEEIQAQTDVLERIAKTLERIMSDISALVPPPSPIPHSPLAEAVTRNLPFPGKEDEPRA